MSQPLIENDEISIASMYSYQQEDGFPYQIGDMGEAYRHTIARNADGFPLFVIMHARNSYILSMARHFSFETMKRMGKTSCYQINSLEFFIAITNAIQDPVINCTLGNVSYCSDSDLLKIIANIIEKYGENELNQYLPRISRMKRPEFSWQDEVRAIWEPIGRIDQAKDLRHSMSGLLDFEKIRSQLLADDSNNPDLPRLFLKIPGISKFVTRLI